MSCVIHAIDMLKYTADVEVLILGAGPAGILFSQLLKINGASRTVLASNKGRKMDIARQICAGDEYVEFDRDSPDSQWTDLKERYPNGFDVVIDTTGSEEVLNKAIYYVRRGGTLLLYALYSSGCKIQWPVIYMFKEEIQIVTAIGQSGCFSRAIAYLESGNLTTD
ncbi:hypothetical protein Clacol_010170 [Clathrus columnatus]|uniref:Alcohol dehydrogenase-like C-terminal domain-containing protein n=1 Tax=Clathrus columnatus TaxID=1419009 RepID=A0AAV5AQ16_9AGAM|nr:hypothetical protein Clacol_010170 [Clathrus columnatus]